MGFDSSSASTSLADSALADDSLTGLVRFLFFGDALSGKPSFFPAACCGLFKLGISPSSILSSDSLRDSTKEAYFLQDLHS